MTADWQVAMEQAVNTGAGFQEYWAGNPAAVAVESLESVGKVYPFFINRYYLSLIQQSGDAIWRQVVPDIRELQPDRFTADPLAEAEQSPVPGIIHRYPDRVIFLVSHKCPILCRFCMRKRLAGRARPLSPAELEQALAYIKSQPQIREVILSGGDPLMLSTGQLDQILARLGALPRVEVLRIHTRVPSALPHRVTPRLVAVLKKHQPLFVNVHCNHPDEITPAMAAACNALADAGLPLGSQTVLLKDVNDRVKVMQNLLRGFLRLRIRPYYLHHPDLVQGTGHFRVPLERGLKIMAALGGHMSGMAVPRYMIDLPQGGGKVPLGPEYVQGRQGDRLTVLNYDGRPYEYPLDAGEG